MDKAYHEGEIKGKIEMVKSLKKAGVAMHIIMAASGLSDAEIESL